VDQSSNAVDRGLSTKDAKVAVVEPWSFENPRNESTLANEGNGGGWLYCVQNLAAL
jgi:hypothetical protein